VIDMLYRLLIFIDGELVHKEEKEITYSESEGESSGEGGGQ